MTKIYITSFLSAVTAILAISFALLVDVKIAIALALLIVLHELDCVNTSAKRAYINRKKSEHFCNMILKELEEAIDEHKERESIQKSKAQETKKAVPRKKVTSKK